MGGDTRAQRDEIILQCPVFKGLVPLCMKVGHIWVSLRERTILEINSLESTVVS